MAIAEVQIRRDRHVAVVGEAAGALAIPLVPARRVVDDHHAGEGPGAERSGEVRVDQIPVVPPHGHRLGDHAFVLIGLVHVRLPPCEMFEKIRLHPVPSLDRAAPPPLGPPPRAARANPAGAIGGRG